jgi:hypothetical protein
MLAEIEEILVKYIREGLPNIPKEKISSSKLPATSPSVLIKNLRFKFENAGLIENSEEKKEPLRQIFKCQPDSSTKTIKLDEKPLRNSVTVECPEGKFLLEKTDYIVNHENGIVIILKTLGKNPQDIIVKYLSQKSILILKALKLKALYSIDITANTSRAADSLAEDVVKALLNAEEEISFKGIEIKPFRGLVSQGNEDNKTIQLQYLVSKEMRTEMIAEPIDRIAITRKES